MLRLLVAFWWAVGVVASAAVATGPWDGQERRPTESGDDCLRVAASFVQILGHDSHTIPHKKVKDDDLEVCQQTTIENRKSCCTLPVERHLQLAAVDAMREIMASASQHLTDLLVINSQLYRKEFLKLMSLSKNATKQTLTSPSYKLPLSEIEAAIDALFLGLGRFMQRETNADIEATIEEFFDSIFPSVLIYTINEADDGALVSPAQRLCFRAARRDLSPSPFADSVARLTGDLDRSLGVIRLLLQAFDLALEVINSTTAHASFEPGCSRALTRLLRCSYCAGLLEVRPCRSLCVNVVSGCLAHLADHLNDRWNRFVDAVERVVLSMRGADDLQDYLGTFHFRIADSIMTTMETTQSYHLQIVSRCGRVPTSPRPDVTPPPPPATGAGTPAGALRPPASTWGPRGTFSSSSGPTVRLHLKIEMFIRNLADSREFYRKLPDSLCSSENLSAGNYDVCWNGTSLGAYTRPVPGQDFSTQATENPEMKVSESRQTAMVTIAEKLDNMTKILHGRVVPKLTSMQSDGRRTAHAQRTVETSGNGPDDSGSGCGDGCHGTHEDDEDDDDDGSTEEREDADLVTEKVKTSGKGGRKGVGAGDEEGEEGGIEGGAEAIAYVTSADFVFTEKSTVRRVQSTMRSPPEVVAYKSTGSTLYRNAGSLLLLPPLLLLLLLPLSTTLFSMFSTTSILLRIVF